MMNMPLGAHRSPSVLYHNCAIARIFTTQTPSVVDCRHFLTRGSFFNVKIYHKCPHENNCTFEPIRNSERFLDGFFI